MTYQIRKKETTPTITIHIFVKATRDKVFDLALSIDLHQASLGHTDEKVIACVTLEHINMGESFTWRKRQLCVSRTHFQNYRIRCTPYSD